MENTKSARPDRRKAGGGETVIGDDTTQILERLFVKNFWEFFFYFVEVTVEYYSLHHFYRT